jgi:hypothetical protein
MLKTTTRGNALVLFGTLIAAVPAAAQQDVALPGRDRALSDRPANVYTVGAANGESWEMFSGISGMAFDAADNLYVLDSQNTRVVVFDPSGRFVHQFGKRGSGPGELLAPFGLTVASDGHVVINDVGNRAFVVFQPTGEYVRNVPYPLDGTSLLGPIQADPRGGIVVRATRRDPSQPGTSHAQVVRQLLDERSAPVQIARFDVPPPQVVSQSENRRMVINMDPVFAARPSWGVLPGGGLALHVGEPYAVQVHDGAGRHVRTLTRPFTPRRVTKRDRDAYEERARTQQSAGAGIAMTVRGDAAGGGGAAVAFGGGGAGGGAPALPANFERPFADVMSVITNVRTDPAGRIWIQRRHDDGRDAGPIDLVSAEGRYIGTLPAQTLPGAVSSSGLAAWVVRDDMGIERVSVRRLPQSWQ